MQYKMATREGTVEVYGKPIRIKGFEDYKFFYRKDDDVFVISEVSTGMSICRMYTLKQARAVALDVLTERREQFITSVASNKLAQ